jgi:aminoglycoside phosphotransferase family enzyme
MITEDQSDVVAFLSSPAAHGGARVERIDTHTSIVFLAGQRAWKLKRAVRYDYLDYSTVERRRAMCEAEVRINRRTAPALYRGVTAITRQLDGTLAIGGDGAPVDWLVEMARFDEDQVFDRLAEAGMLPLRLMRPLAQAIAAGMRCAASSTAMPPASAATRRGCSIRLPAPG